VTRDVARNTARILATVDRAADSRAELLLTPEGSLSGYTPDFDPNAVADALHTVTERAVARRIGLALGTCFREPNGKCFNQIRFYRPDGTFLGFHSKILRCGSVEGTGTGTGEVTRYAATELRAFDWRPGIRIGGLICNDMWANPECTPMPDPHLSQRLAALGANVILHAVNGGRNGGPWSEEVAWRFHEANLRMRARAGRLWIVTADSATPENLPCSAPSGVIAPTGDFVLRTDRRGEQLFVFDLPVGAEDGDDAGKRS
jgi:predicted amidohydrolase